jgi:putative oxidoreductase
VLGAVLTAHGWPKLKDLRQNARNFNGMGFKPGVIWGTIAAFLEVIGGIGMMLGLWVPYLCLIFMVEFAVILIWKWFKRLSFVSGWELEAIIFSLLLMIFTLYGGFFLI